MLEIFQYKFMIRAFLAGMVIAVIAPLIGAFLVVRRYSILADTLAHVSLAGVAVGMLTKTHPVAAAVFLSALSAFGIELIRSLGVRH
jgi:zinc transport system permease protein